MVCVPKGTVFDVVRVDGIVNHETFKVGSASKTREKSSSLEDTEKVFVQPLAVADNVFSQGDKVVDRVRRSGPRSISRDEKALVVPSVHEQSRMVCSSLPFVVPVVNRKHATQRVMPFSCDVALHFEHRRDNVISALATYCSAA